MPDSSHPPRRGDGVGECYCFRTYLSDFGRPASARLGVAPSSCWVCEGRKTRLSLALMDVHAARARRAPEEVIRHRERTAMPRTGRHALYAEWTHRRDEANGYGEVINSAQATWLPGDSRPQPRPCSYEVWRWWQGQNPVGATGAMHKYRSTLNPFARDLHHIRTGERWFGGEWWRETETYSGYGPDVWAPVDRPDWEQVYVGDADDCPHEWGTHLGEGR